MRKRKFKTMFLLKLSVTILSIVICGLWFFYPSKIEWEPILVAVGLLIHFCLDLYDKKQQEKKIKEITNEIKATQTGGETYCYLMLYDFSIENSLAKDFVFIKPGVHSLYNLNYRLVDYTKKQNNTIINDTSLGEMNAPAIYQKTKWRLNDRVHYGVFFTARNGNWTQELILRKSVDKNYWLAATRVVNRTGKVIHKYLDNDFETIFGVPNWKNKHIDESA